MGKSRFWNKAFVYMQAERWMDTNTRRVVLTRTDLCYSFPPREPVFRQAKRNSSEMNSHRVGSELDFPVGFPRLRVSVLLLTTEGNTRNGIRHFPAESYRLFQTERERWGEVGCRFKRERVKGR